MVTEIFVYDKTTLDRAAYLVRNWSPRMGWPGPEWSA